jgi:hypothetical protein
MATHHARTASACVGMLLAACLLAPADLGAADSAAAPPVAALQLKDGRILHNARVIADEGDSVVVRADEGLVKVAKVDLPPAVATFYPAPTPTPAAEQMVMVPFNPNPSEATQEPEGRPKAKPAPENVPNTAQNNNLSYRGCTIVSFQVKAFQNLQGCAEVVVTNGTDMPVVIFPRNLVCSTSGGARHAGRYFVTDGFPPIIRRREVVPAQGSIDEQVIFTNDAIDISGMQWGR